MWSNSNSHVLNEAFPSHFSSAVTRGSGALQLPTCQSSSSTVSEEVIYSGDAQERRSLACPSEKWVLAERTHLSRGQSGWEAHGVRKSPAWSYRD